MKLSKDIKTLQLFKRYLFSYLLIMFVPIIVMGFWVYNNLTGIFQKEVTTNAINSLDKIRYVIDSQFEQLQKTTTQMYFNKNLRPFKFLDDPLTAVNVKTELQNYAAANNFFKEIFLYYRGDNYLYSSSSSYSVSSFINEIFNYTDWKEEDFIKDLNFITTPVLRPSENVRNGTQVTKYVTLLYPLSSDNANPFGTALFLIEDESFKRLMKNALKDYEGNTIILDNNNNVISNLNEVDYPSSKDVIKYINTKGNIDNKIIPFNGKKYFLSVIKSNNTNFKYINLIPVNNITEKVNVIKIQFIYGLAIIFLIGSLVIFYLMQINYSPIKELKKYTEKLYTGNKESLNEIELVHKTIDFLSQQNMELNVKIKDNSKAAKDFLIINLLKGEFTDQAEFINTAKETGITFTNPHFFSSVLNIKTPNETDEKNELINVIENSMPDNFEGYIVEAVEKNTFMLLIASEFDNVNSLQESLNVFHNNIKTNTNGLITIGVGNIYDDITMMPKSYIEASTAMDYRLIKGLDKIILFNEILPKESELSNYPSKYFDEFKISIFHGDTEQIENSLSNILSYIKEENTPIFIARGICFDIIKILATSMSSISKDFTISKQEYPDIFSLTKFETIDDLIILIKEISFDICKYINETKKDSNSNFVNSIISYINENYTRCDFSIQEIADHFNVSLSNLSQYFKDNNGQTIIDYLTCLKIEKAKQVLSTTNLPLKDVAIEVGYYNVSSFIRRFKQVTGITPGEYRKLYKTEEI